MATGQQNINIGTADNANDGDVLRAAFRKVRKMFAEIYGDTDAENLTDTETVPSTSFDTHITEKIEDTVASMFSGGTHSNITVVYDDNDGTLDLDVSADIDSVTTAANSGLDGGVQDGDATLSLDLNNLSSATVDVAADSIGIVDASDSNNTKKETIADVVDAVAGSGLTATNGVLSVDSIDTDGIANDAVDGTKLGQFDDTLTAATAGDILVSNGTDFIHATMSGDATIASGGALTIGNDKITEAKLGAEFTTTSAISASAVDFSSAAVFTKTLSANTTLTFSNVTTGAVKTLVISGDFTLTLPSGVKTLNGTYSGTADSNVIQIISTNGSTEMFATISNYSAS